MGSCHAEFAFRNNVAFAPLHTGGAVKTLASVCICSDITGCFSQGRPWDNAVRMIPIKSQGTASRSMSVKVAEDLKRRPNISLHQDHSSGQRVRV